MDIGFVFEETEKLILMNDQGQIAYDQAFQWELPDFLLRSTQAFKNVENRCLKVFKSTQCDPVYSVGRILNTIHNFVILLNLYRCTVIVQILKIFCKTVFEKS